MKNRLLLGAIIAIAFSSLTGCEQRKQGTLVRAEYQNATLIHFDKPKHVYAQFRFQDGTPSDNIWVAKHCLNHRSKAVVGREYRILVKYVKVVDENGKERLRRYLERSNIDGLLCR